MGSEKLNVRQDFKAQAAWLPLPKWSEVPKALQCLADCNVGQTLRGRGSLLSAHARESAPLNDPGSESDLVACSFCWPSCAIQVRPAEFG